MGRTSAGGAVKETVGETVGGVVKPISRSPVVGAMVDPSAVGEIVGGIVKLIARDPAVGTMVDPSASDAVVGVASARTKNT